MPIIISKTHSIYDKIRQRKEKQQILTISNWKLFETDESIIKIEADKFSVD